MTFDSLPARITSKIVRGSGCWEWTGGTSDSGYGVARGADGARWRVRRLVWVAMRGPVADGVSVISRCQNRLCCNPDHMFLRRRRGPSVRNSRPIMSSDDIQWIRAWSSAGYSRISIAKAFRIGVKAVGNALDRHTGSNRG